MIKKWILRALYAALVLLPVGAIADYTATTGSGSTVFAFVCFVSKICPAQVLMNSAGTEIATSGNPIRVDPTGTTTQPVSAASLPLPTGAGTSANQTTINTSIGTTNTNLGAQADPAWVSGSGSLIAIAKNIAAGVGSAIPAGSATIGNTVPAPTSNSALALTDVACGSAVSSCVLKAAAGNFYGVYAECTSACWLMVFNSTTAPSNGATTAGKASGNMVECISLTGSAGGGKSINYPTFPIPYSAGITVAISSTACATLTLSTVGFIHGSVL